MKKQNSKQTPIINDNDLIYSYKEQWFTGFAPCFQNGIYSLACCKGNKKTGGMRHSVCENIESGKTVWVISIAGEDIQSEGHNGSEIDYRSGDAIYLAKINKALALEEYSEKYSQRSDAIYSFKNGTIIRNGNSRDVHMTEEEKRTDCTLDCGWSHSQIFSQFKQIIMADEYYVFKPGSRIFDTSLDVRRGYTYLKGGETRVEDLRELLKNSEFAFVSGDDPFYYVNTKGKVGCRK